MNQQNKIKIKEGSTINCPYCTDILFKNASFKDEGELQTVCPHCGKAVLVIIELELRIKTLCLTDEK